MPSTPTSSNASPVPIAGPADRALRLDDLVATTPAHRSRAIDLLRAVAIASVVLGHWTLAVVAWGPDGLRADNLLELVPWTRWLTWVFQVMPLFFVVGGWASAASWRSARRREERWPSWVRGRLDRLLRPVWPLLLLWTVGLAGALALGADPEVLRDGARIVGMPLWFLAVYVPITALTPALVELSDRVGPRRATAAWVVLAGLVDVAVHHGHPALGWANFGFVWLACAQGGIAWHAGALDRSSARWLLALAAIGLGVLVGPLGYATSMVGFGAQASNTTPPNLALLALGAAQLALAVGAQPALDRWLARPRRWRAVVAVNVVAMPLYLWHLTALCLVTLTVVRLGWFPTPPPGSGAWWASRPLWIVLLALALVPFVLAAARWERHAGDTPADPNPRAVAVVASTAAATAGLAVIALHGLPVRHTPWAGPTTVAVLACGAALRTGKQSLRPARRGPGDPSPRR